MKTFRSTPATQPVSQMTERRSDRVPSAATRGGLLLSALSALTLAACSGSSNDVLNPPSGGNGDSDFAVQGSTVLDGVTWQLNRPIDIVFNEDVDFSTVSLSTVQIVDSQGVPAVGTFTLATPRTVRFQPVCPTNDTNSDGGLLQGRDYRITVPSESSPGIGGGVTVQNTAGERLETGLNINFVTPESTDELVLFVDTVAGPPQVVIRGLNGTPTDSEDSSFVEFPGRPAGQDREFLTFNVGLQQGVITSNVPLNLYSDQTQQFDFVLQFNQPIIAASTNVNSSRIGLEYLNQATSTWDPVPSSVELLSNCTENGSSVKLTPTGIVPQGSQLRAVVREGFRDLTGDPVPSTLANFARVTSDVANPGGANPDDGTDRISIEFNAPGDVTGSLEDTETPAPSPRANWSGPNAPGVLEASFDFAGTGGPGGDFDWVVPANQTVIISTDADTIQGGPNGFPTNQQAIIGGIINVRDLRVEPGARVTFIGSNTVTILATGNVDIDGILSVDGGDNPGVGTLNTTNQPELGASGGPGGGDGGVASFRTSQSTPRGGPGFGAFNVPGLGGEGGETGYAPGGACAKDNRRGAGGGGGALGNDVRYDWQGNFLRCQTLIGMDIERGITGSFDGTGAVSQNQPSQGGAPGPQPFIDSSDENNFFGTLLTADGRQIRGELARLWAGAGGGGGGDAVRSATFPLTPFTITGDEKGCGGGGGAGGIEILVLGRTRGSTDPFRPGGSDPRPIGVTVGPTGSISADGGTGNGGENTSFFDRVGGGSGGGSGGHIVVSCASNIWISGEATATSVGEFYLDNPTSPVHEKRPITALGGQGGAGRQSFCGANEDGEAQWNRDSIPAENFEGNTSVPPNGSNTWENLCGLTATCSSPFPLGEHPGAGGDGGPGIIQFHVSDPATQLLFPNRPGVYADQANPVDPTRSCSPPPFGWTTPTDPVDVFLPFFSARSEAFSDWIPLGLARKNPGGAPDDQVILSFGGTDTLTGDVLRNGTEAQELAPLVAYTGLTQGGANPSVNSGTGTFTIDGASLPAIYQQNPALLVRFAVRVRDLNSPATEVEYLVQSATYDSGADEFALVVDNAGLADQLLALANPEVEIVPFFFRLSAAGVEDSFPPNTEIRILFDAARANPATGDPSTDPLQIFSGGDVSAFTADINDLNVDVWDFVRVKFEFLIDIDDRDAARPGIDYLQILYGF